MLPNVFHWIGEDGRMTHGINVVFVDGRMQRRDIHVPDFLPPGFIDFAIQLTGVGPTIKETIARIQWGEGELTPRHKVARDWVGLGELAQRHYHCDTTLTPFAEEGFFLTSCLIQLQFGAIRVDTRIV